MKTVHLTVSFLTKGASVRAEGFVRVRADPERGIRSGNSVTFLGVEDIPRAVEDVLSAHNLELAA